MITDLQVYVAYIRENSRHTGLTFYMPPDDWDTFKTTRLNRNVQNHLTLVSEYFTQENVIPLDWMKIGFELVNNFSYDNMLDKKIKKAYDKLIKEREKIYGKLEQEIGKSFKQIDKDLKKAPDQDTLTELPYFCTLVDGQYRTLIQRYKEDTIDETTVTYCITKGYIVLTPEEIEATPDIHIRWSDQVLIAVTMDAVLVANEEALESKKKP